MKNIKKFLVTFALVFITVTAFSTTSQAAAKKPTCVKSKTTYWIKVGKDKVWSDDYDGYTIIKNNLKWSSFLDVYHIRIKNISKDAIVTDIKSSNKKVAPSASYQYTEDGGFIFVDAGNNYYKSGAIKEGTTTISFKVHQNGKTYNLSCKYTIKKRPSPLKSLKIDGKQYAPKLKGKGNVNYKVKKKYVTISFEGKKNVEVLDAYYIDSNFHQVSVKSGSKVYIPKKGCELYIVYKYAGKGTGYKKWYGTSRTDCVYINFYR